MSFFNEIGDLLYISKGIKKEIEKNLIFLLLKKY